MFYSYFVCYSVFNEIKLKSELLYATALCDQNWTLKFSKNFEFIFLEIYKLFWSNFIMNVSNIDRSIYYSNELLWAIVF